LQALDGKGPQANRITVEIDSAPETIEIAITDTGAGLPDPDRIFEPFFTTKSAHVGTGLGLFVCKQIVERMRGRIAVVSTGVRGTKLAVTLPRRKAPVPQPTARAGRVPGDRLRVLVIDDEPHVRRAIRNVLASEHDVEIVGDGEAALATLASTQFDVIICDLMMPQLTGRDVYEQIRARWPGLERRVVFITGGAFVPALAAFLDSIDNLTLLKPFTIEGIREIVRQARAQGS
jgi:CheY-like chemotaxis protein